MHVSSAEHNVRETMDIFQLYFAVARAGSSHLSVPSSEPLFLILREVVPLASTFEQRPYSIRSFMQLLKKIYAWCYFVFCMSNANKTAQFADEDAA